MIRGDSAKSQQFLAKKCRIQQENAESGKYFQIPMTFSRFRWLFFFKFWCFLYSSDLLDPTDVHLYPKPTRPIFPTGRVRVGSKTDLARLVDSPNSSSSDLMSYYSWEKKKKKKKPILERLLKHSFPLFSSFTLYILAMHVLLEMLLWTLEPILGYKYNWSVWLRPVHGCIEFVRNPKLAQLLRVFHF